MNEHSTPKGAGWRAAAVSFGPSLLLDVLLAASTVGTAIAIIRGGRWRGSRWLRLPMMLGALAPPLYALVIRPWLVRWGATDDEANGSLFGDTLVQDAPIHMTRAVTVNAPPPAVWPWLAQWGQGKGGLYSYDWLENLAGLEIHSVDHILPEHQRIEPGDFVALSPGGKELRVEEVVPERAIVMRVNTDQMYGGATMNATWTLAIQPLDEHRCRVLSRWRAGGRPSVLFQAFYVLTTEVPHFVMERKMLLGIKERAERLTPSGDGIGRSPGAG